MFAASATLPEFEANHPSRHDKDSEISPGSVPALASSSQKQRAQIAPWETSATFKDYRKDLAVLDTSAPKIPAINRQPPTAISTSPPWDVNNGSYPMTSSVFSNSFYNDSSDDLPQISPGFPGFRTGSAYHDEIGFREDDRRPSIASATTVSSQGSKSSVGRGFHKKLQNIFGEEYQESSRQNSDSSLPPGIERPPSRLRARNNSVTDGTRRDSRPTSPSSFRPKSPMPSSEVTPWEFQVSLPWKDEASITGRSWLSTNYCPISVYPDDDDSLLPSLLLLLPCIIIPSKTDDRTYLRIFQIRWSPRNLWIKAR